MIIDFINTGGTINSKAGKHSLAVATLPADTAKQALNNTPLGKLIYTLEQELDFSSHTHTPWQKNSEDVNPADWQQLLSCLMQCNHSSSHAILVSHGTDTMAYSLALAACFDNFWRKPICFTGAFISPALTGSDAELNLRAALLYLKQQASLSQNGNHSCQLAFQTSDEQARIMPASWVLPLRCHDRYFETAYQQYTASFSGSTVISADLPQKIDYPRLDCDLVPELLLVQQANSRILYQHYYPGMCIQTLLQHTKEVDILIIEAFHSGTASFTGNNSLLAFIKQFKGLVIISSLPGTYLQKPYHSSLALLTAGACLLKDIPGHYVYIYCLLRLAQTPALKQAQLKKYLCNWQLNSGS